MRAQLRKMPLVGAIGLAIACSVCLLPAVGALIAFGAVTSALGGVTSNAAVVVAGAIAVAIGAGFAVAIVLRKRSAACVGSD